MLSVVGLYRSVMALCDYCLSIQLPNPPTLAECAYWLTDAYVLQTFQMDYLKIKIHVHILIILAVLILL